MGTFIQSQKLSKNWTRGKERFNTYKNRPIFCIKKLILQFLKNFPRFDLTAFFFFFLFSHYYNYKTYNISLTKFMKQDRCDGRDARVVCKTNISVKNISEANTKTSNIWQTWSLLVDETNVYRRNPILLLCVTPTNQLRLNPGLRPHRLLKLFCLTITIIDFRVYLYLSVGCWGFVLFWAWPWQSLFINKIE